MRRLVLFVLALLTGSAAADVEGISADCYHITMSIIVGIVAGDVLLTVLLLIPVYYCTRQKNKRPVDRGDKNYVNMIGIRD